MKKKIWIPIVALVLLLAILFVPIPQGAYDDGGTREWIALTYKIVDWNRIYTGGIYDEIRFYGSADRNKSIGELWERERPQREYDDNMAVTAKPVIYLYPERETEISVKLEYNGQLTCTYPTYNNGWTVVAAPDGTLTDENGRTYNYLYWEGVTIVDYDFSKGFCVKGEDTAEFLEASLEALGLTRREANEFIVYWLPLMQDNEYNVISFQTNAYTDAAGLEITPAPDTLIRVFMAWKASNEYIEIESQELTAPGRRGFIVVEWGGTEVK